MKRIVKEIFKTTSIYIAIAAFLGLIAMQPANPPMDAMLPQQMADFDAVEAEIEYHPTLEEIEDGVLRQMFYAICKKETGFDSTHVNRAEDAVGIAQIRRIMVDDANRILGFDRFSYMDRLSVRESFEIFKVIVLHYCRELDFDSVIDRWNPGCGRKYREDCWTYYMEGIEYEF